MPLWTVCLCLFLALPTCALTELVPRITFHLGDPSRAVSSFFLDKVLNYDELLLSENGETLYVGARDNILSLSVKETGCIQLLKQISWKTSHSQISNCISKAKSNETECFNFIRILLPMNNTHLYTCGTNAFSPSCTLIDLETFSIPTNDLGDPLTYDGKGQSPFDPRHKHTAVMVDGELYTATMNNFQGNEPIIFHNLSNRPALKTDASLGWLQSDTSFVASFVAPGTAAESKVYFFFEETMKEFDFYEKFKVSRVARVCKNDVGGDKVLQNKWTTFLKAQLLCSHPDYFHFNVIQHVSLLYPEDPERSTFYGVFSSQWQMGGTSSSAVCSFNLKDIEEVFNGSYKEQNKESSRWMTYMGPVSTPRPGSCSVGSSSDKDLTFMKDHFLMDGMVSPGAGRPLLIKQNVRYTRIAIDTVEAVSGRTYTVMFLGTDKGSLHKAVLVNNGIGSHIIEELQLLPSSEPIQNLLLAADKGVLYIGHATGILQVPLTNCSVYGSCFDCVLARDPYCAWDRDMQRCQQIQPKSERTVNSWLQDIESGNPNTTCVSPAGKARAMRPGQDSDLTPARAKNYTDQWNTILKLDCPHFSALANYSWSHPSKMASEKQVLISSDTLVILVSRHTVGLYECWAVENGFKYQVARYWVIGPNGLVSYTGSMDESNMALDDGQTLTFTKAPSYYSAFVVVAVLFTVTLLGIAGLALYTCRDKVRNKSKVEGCSTPETESLAKAKMKGNAHNSSYQISRDNGQFCCVPLKGSDGKMDIDNNRVTGASADAASEKV